MKKEGKRLLEWAGEFAAQNFQTASQEDILSSFGIIAHSFGVQALGTAVGFKFALSQEDNTEALNYGRKVLGDLAKSIREFFELMHSIRDMNIQASWQETSVLEPDRNKILKIVKGWQETTLELYDVDSPNYLDSEGNPQPFKEVKLSAELLSLLYALEGNSLRGFQKCPICKRIFFHWRKKDRIYCSSKCKNYAAVLRYRSKAS
jgi:hypothetical protein